MHEQLSDAALPKASKLAVVMHLMRSGWRPRRQMTRASSYQRGGEKVFWCGDSLGASTSYFLALARAEAILARHSPEFSIHHRMPDTYYRALLLLTSPSSIDRFRSIISSASIGSLGAAHFQDILADVSLEDPSALEDMPPLAEERSLDDMPELSDDQAEALAAQIAGGAIPAEKVDLRCTVNIGVPTGASSASGFPAELLEVKVLFDNCSHRSGNQRMYAACNVHRACYKYKQVRQFPSMREGLAFMAAWAVSASCLEVDAHKAFNPSESDVNKMLPYVHVD